MRLARAVALALALLTPAFTAARAAQTSDAPTTSTSTPASPTRFVTDGADFLSAAARDALERRLAQYERDTGHQVLLWIGQTTGGEPIESWAVRAFEAWKVGSSGLDDGVAVFIFAADRRIRIEVGYGLEDRLPDALASRIINEQMIPRLRAGDQDGAARAAVDGVLAAVGGESGAARDAAPAARPEIAWGRLIVVGLIAIVALGFLISNPTLALLLLTTLDSHRHGGRGHWGGGRWGGGGFGGGSWGGGGWGGGGFGGGGFSGGGGRSGGGGASGSW